MRVAQAPVLKQILRRDRGSRPSKTGSSESRLTTHGLAFRLGFADVDRRCSLIIFMEASELGRFSTSTCSSSFLCHHRSAIAPLGSDCRGPCISRWARNAHGRVFASYLDIPMLDKRSCSCCWAVWSRSRFVWFTSMAVSIRVRLGILVLQ